MALLNRLLRKGLLKLPDVVRRRAYGALSIGSMALAALAARRRANGKIRITVFDRRPSGNLRAFILRMQQIQAPIEFGFLSLDLDRDRQDWARLPAGVRPLDGLSLDDMGWAIRSDVFLSSIFARRFRKLIHQLAPSIKFVQVFHSISLSADPQWWFDHMGRFDRLFVSSEWMKQELFVPHGVPADRLRATGFATLDELARPTRSRQQLCRELRLDPDRPIILCAPTLVGSHVNRSGGADGPPREARIIPVHDSDFLEAANCWAARHDVQFVIRTHPHEGEAANESPDRSHVLHRPATRYPDATAQMLVADAMVSDVSGIAAYYLALRRPLIFWAPYFAPGTKATFLTADSLPGPAVHSPDELFATLTDWLTVPDQFQSRYGERLEQSSRRAFGDTLDGDAALRYYAEIRGLLGLSAAAQPPQRAGVAA